MIHRLYKLLPTGKSVVAAAAILIMLGELMVWAPPAKAAAVFSFDISGETSDPLDIAYSTDTSHYYVLDNADTLVYEYDDFGVYVDVFIDPSVDGASDITSIDYDPTNEYFYILDAGQAIIYIYDASGSYVDQYDVSSVTALPYQVAWDDDNGELLLTGITVGSSTIYELNSDGTPTGTSFDVTVAASGYPPGMTVGGGYIWIINDMNWNVVRLDRDTGATAGATLDISDSGAGNPEGLDYFAYQSGYLFYIDSGSVYVYPYQASGSGSVDDDSYFPALAGWWSTIASDSLNLWQGIYAGSYYAEIAIRFLDVAVAQGATITSATLRLVTGDNSSTGSFGTLYGNDSDDAAAWSISVTPDTIATTTASTTFTVTDDTPGTTQDFDVTDIVQEIVNRPGWQPGNAMAFAGDTAGLFDVPYASNFAASESGYPPQLIIETADGGEDEPPARELRLQGGVRLMDGVRLY